MKETIVAPIPKGYKLSSKAADLLKIIDRLEGGQQLTVLQEIVVNMGYSEMGGTPQVKEPVIPPKEAAPRAKVTIKGIKNATVLSYMENMNAFDFPAAVALFGENKIFFVGIDLLASPQELVELGFVR